MKGIICDGCGEPFTAAEWEDRHTPHEPDCPNRDTCDTGIYVVDSCECDRNYHSRCAHMYEGEGSAATHADQLGAALLAMIGE